MAEPLTEEEVAELRETHYEDRPLRSVCHDCEEPWPCPTTRLLDELAQLRERGGCWHDDVTKAHGACDCLLCRLARTCDRVAALQRDNAKLHTLVTEARNYIDPEEHPEWEQAAFGECTPCEDAIDRLRAERDALAARLRAVRLALESLTPGGSEYVDDPKRCARYVREAREQQHRVIVNLSNRLRALGGSTRGGTE